MLKNLTLVTILFAAFINGARAADAPKPKYGPEATVLSKSHEYFRTHAATEFWTLMPYYLPQQDGRSCSVASVAMLMNALRSGEKMTADDELVTQPGLLKKVGDDHWKKDVGDSGHGVTLDELGQFIGESMKAYGVEGSAKVFHTEDLSEKTAAALHEALMKIDGGRVYIVANFIQGVYTGDADAGHIAPVGAYDAAKKRVLVLDPDREWYEPYWVSEKTFLAGMATHDKESDHSRGYVLVNLSR